MSAPEDADDRRGFLDAPRWMDGHMAEFAAPGFALLGIGAAVGILVIASLAASGSAGVESLWLAGALLGVIVLCVILYRSADRRRVVDDAPRGADPARHFRVTLLATGGWLSRYLSPTVDAHLVLADEQFRLRYRRPRNELWLAAMVLHFSGLSGRFLPGIPKVLLFAGNVVLLGLYVWSHGIRYDRRYPWSRVVSVAAAHGRFHVKVDDDEFPEGFLVQVRANQCKTVAELLRGKALFHDEDAPEPGSS